MKATVGLLALLLLVAGCSPGRSQDLITVGSYDFIENQLAAEIVAQALESAGFTVERLDSFQTRNEMFAAREDHPVEVMIEYLGSLSSHLGEPPTAQVPETMAQLDDATYAIGLALLAPTSVSAAPAVVVLRSTAETLGLDTVSDLSEHASSFVIGGKQDCAIDEQCLLGLSRTYGLTFRSFVPLDAGGPLTVEALRDREINVAVLFNTDSALAGDELKVLTDDLGLMATEVLVPMVTLNMVEARRKVVEAALADMTVGELRLLVGQVETGELTVRQAASEYLSSR
jgi:osmoprotectant transport system substrate-binding protein